MADYLSIDDFHYAGRRYRRRQRYFSRFEAIFSLPLSATLSLIPAISILMPLAAERFLLRRRRLLRRQPLISAELRFRRQPPPLMPPSRHFRRQLIEAAAAFAVIIC